MSQIYFLEPDVQFNQKLEYVSGLSMETTLCPLNAGLPSQHAMRQRWQHPLKILAPVQRMTDFEWTVFRDIVIEKDIVDGLQKAKLSGVTFQPVQLYTTTETPIGRQAFELTVTGWGGMARPESGIRVVEECRYCKRRVYSGFTDPSQLFSPEAWDGSDLFIIWPMPKFTFITKRVADFIKQSDYSGLRIKPLEQLPKSIAGGYSPGHLHDWFEGKKLDQIMEHFQAND